MRGRSRRTPPAAATLDFWLNELPRRSEAEGCLAEVLDSLCRRLDASPYGTDDSSTRGGAAKMLALALERHGEGIEAARLYAWLAALMPWMPNESDLDPLGRIGRRLGVVAPEEDVRSRVDAWLGGRPSMQKALIGEIVRRQDDRDIIFPTASVSSTGSLSVDDVLAGAPLADFAPWFLEQAVRLSESRPRLARHMLLRTVFATRPPADLPDHLRDLRDEVRDRRPTAGESERDPDPKALPTSDGLTLDEIRARISGDPRLEEWLESMLAPSPQPSTQHPLARERTRKRKEWIDWVRRHADALGRGEGPPRAYHEIARAYLGVNPSVRGNTARERLRDLFLDDSELPRVALAGLRRMARRTDLPTLDELVRLDEDGTISYFALPLLAALEEEERTGDPDPARLEGGGLRRALGSFFFARGYEGPDPAWYRRALGSRPQDVADAFVKVYRSRIRRSSGVDRHLGALTGEESHGKAARRAIPRLLESFPAKASAAQAFYLNYLIPAALEYVDPDELMPIVRRKLEAQSLGVGHRIRWLAAGMLLGDQPSGEELDRFLARGSDLRVRELASFLQVDAVSKRVRSLSAPSLATLVRRLGRYFAPSSGGGPHSVSHEVDEALQTGGFIRKALDALSRFPSPEATELIRALLDDKDLAAWQEPIAEASDAQRVARLDAEFEPPTIAKVVSVLRDGRPASAADLAALAADRIRAIGEQARDGDGGLWRHFWSEGQHGRPETPKIEPSCQLALLAALRPWLPERVQVASEATYAGGTRADLQISFGDWAVPVETKMSSSGDLWTAAADQLIPSIHATRDRTGTASTSCSGTAPNTRSAQPRQAGPLEHRASWRID